MGTNKLVQSMLVSASESALAEGLMNANEKAAGKDKKKKKNEKK